METCRLCSKTNDPTIIPCKCPGYVHRSCLNAQRVKNPGDFRQCPKCAHKYTTSASCSPQDEKNKIKRKMRLISVIDVLLVCCGCWLITPHLIYKGCSILGFGLIYALVVFACVFGNQAFSCFVLFDDYKEPFKFEDMVSVLNFLVGFVSLGCCFISALKYPLGQYFRKRRGYFERLIMVETHPVENLTKV